MGFYYTSVFSIVPLGVAYGALALLYWTLVRGTRGLRGRAALLAVGGTVFLVLPVAEELWIAWNFSQVCKGAGTFINKRVQVEGFYDDTRTTHAGTPTAQAVEDFERSGYRFLEMKGREKFIRIEKIDGQWKPVALDRPTARHHFKQLHDHTKVSHEVKKFEWVVVDSQSGEQLAREVAFARGPSWYFVWLDRPTLFCSVSGKHGERLVATLYTEVLLPAVHR